MLISELDLRPVDPDSAADRAAWGVLLTTIEQDAFGASGRYGQHHVRPHLVSTPYTERHVLGAFTPAGDLAGHMSLDLSLQENLDRAALEIEVVPAWRGRGLGTALADRARERATELGRPKLETWAPAPLDGDPDDRSLPVNRLAARLGLTRRNLEVCRTLDLPVTSERLAAARASHRPATADYRIETFRGPVPTWWETPVGLLQRQLELDEPTGDVEHEAADYDADRIRNQGERLLRSGRDALTALAVASDGTLAGMSELVWQRAAGTTLGWQGTTLVMPDHRGRRLGITLKDATHSALPAVAPGVRRVVTWNSQINPHMIAVNEALGYVPREREIAFQD